MFNVDLLVELVSQVCCFKAFWERHGVIKVDISVVIHNIGMAMRLSLFNFRPCCADESATHSEPGYQWRTKWHHRRNKPHRSVIQGSCCWLGRQGRARNSPSFCLVICKSFGLCSDFFCWWAHDFVTRAFSSVIYSECASCRKRYPKKFLDVYMFIMTDL